jgi:N12 class adenine-specific DNA methylase
MVTTTKTNFYAYMGREGWKPVEGEKINIPGFEKYDFYLHRPLDSEGNPEPDKWVISEGQTGQALISSDGVPSQEEAAEQASKLLTKAGSAKLDNLIDASIANHGKSPAYASNQSGFDFGSAVKESKEVANEPATTRSGQHGESSDLPAGGTEAVQRQRAREHGAEVSEGEQSGSPPATSEGRGTGGISPGAGESLPELRGESGAERGVVGRGLEPGNPPGTAGERERLTEPSQAPVNEPALPPRAADRDIKLDDIDIGFKAGAASRFDANLAAIRTLKQLEDEHRDATPEEQAVLAKYSGFGDSAFSEAFPGYEPGSWATQTPWLRRRKELKALTTDEEFKAIEGSRLNAFYTTPDVIKAMWHGLDRLGISNLPNIRLLEPSAGSGRFLGYEPAELKAKSDRAAVELDSLTGRILKKLYPEAATYVMGFERAPIGKETVDVAISNVPFGNYPVFDRTFKKERKKLTHSIHNYFFAKTLEELRPGGVLAFITSHQTLDAKTTKPVREYLASQADLLGAIRLPNNAFPDTKVCTDIIFMRKRMPNESPADKSWVDTRDQHFKWESRYGDELEADIPVNQYFIKHPEMVMGRPSAEGSMNPRSAEEGEYTVDPAPGLNLNERLNDAIQKLPANVVTEAPRHAALQTIYGVSAKEGTPLSAREGSRIVRDDGHVYIKHDEILEPASLNDAEEAKVKKMLAIRDAAKNLVDMQVNNKPDAEMLPAQEQLNKLYKEYVLENGPLSAPANSDLLEKDPDEPFLQALENHNALDAEKEKRTPADERLVKLFKGSEKVQENDLGELKMPIFSKRVIHGMAERPVTDYADAISVSRNITGRLDIPFIARKMGKSEDEVTDALRERNLIFKNPVGDWEPADQYLSGDVREKLQQAVDAASARPNEYRRNVEALKSVQPPDIPPGQIGAKMGATWIPASDINAFVKDLLKAESAYRYSWRHGEEEQNAKDQYYFYRPLTGTWVINHKPEADEAILKSEYGTQRIDATHILERILNGQLVEVNDKVTGDDGKEHTVRNQPETIAAQDKAALIQRKFDEWIWSDADRAQRLAKIYNETFNNYHPRVYDGSHQAMPGISEKWSKLLHPHQRDAIWRVVQDRTALLAHEVGFGKTAVMVGSGMELRRLGQATKIVYVVPKATHPQFKQQFQDLYPYAKILYPEEDDFSDQKRPEFISRAITGDWDAIILSDTQFRRIPVRPETEAKFVQDELDTMMEVLHDTSDKRTQKQIAEEIKRMTVKLQGLTAKAAEVADQTVFFEDMGVDQLFVDEADNFKNLHFATKMGRIKGLPNSESDRAWDMYEKVRCLQDRDKKAGVVFATGTPIANTIAEMYTMMRYLQEPLLEEKGMKHFDSWAKTFGQTTESIEQTPTGLYRMTQRFAKFNNAPELSSMWQGVADIRVADEVPEMVKVRPHIVDENGKQKRMVVSVEPDRALLDYMKLLADRADNLKNVTPEEDNMLKISNDARKAALDMRLVDAEAPPNPRTKINACCDKITEIYKQTTPDKGTQLVFLDLGTPKARDKVEDNAQPAENIEEDTDEEKQLLTNVYAKIKEQLIASGIPAQEIAFIHDAKNDKQRNALQDKVNSGEIRVIIGSTSKLGTGVNIQQRAAALHHLDAPWRPRDIEQREGRIVRQGNQVYGPKLDENGEVIDPGPGVKIYTYVTERSFDAYMWQAVEAKSKAIKAIMRRSAPPRAIEDVDSFTISASEAKALASGNPDVLKQVTLKNNVTRFQMLRSSWLDSQLRAKAKVKDLPLEIKATTEDKVKLEQDARQIKNLGDKFTIKVNGVEIKERPVAGEAIVDLVKKGQSFGQEIADYRGFRVKVIDNGQALGYALIIRNPETGDEYGNKNIFPYSELNPAGVMSRVDHRIDGVKEELQNKTNDLTALERSLKSYTEQAAKPFEYQDRLDQMSKELERLEKKLQGEKVAESEAPSDLYTAEVPEETEPAYRWTSKKDEVINPVAEVAAVKAEVAPVEKELEVKAPPTSIETTVEKMAEPKAEEKPLSLISVEPQPVTEIRTKTPEDEKPNAADVEKQPYEMTRDEFNNHYTYLKDMSEIDQRRMLDKMIQHNKETIGEDYEAPAFDDFKRDFAGVRWIKGTGEVMPYEHPEVVANALKDRLELPEAVKAEYRDVIAAAKVKQAKAKASKERKIAHEKAAKAEAQILPLASTGNRPQEVDTDEEYQRYEAEKAALPKGKYGELEATSEPAATPDADSDSTQEPWQMTKEEFEEANYEGEDVTGWNNSPEKAQADKWIHASESLSKRTTSKEEKTRAEAMANQAQAIADEYYEKHDHKTQVAQALAEGKQVPSQVLADYPDLTPGRQRASRGFHKAAIAGALPAPATNLVNDVQAINQAEENRLAAKGGTGKIILLPQELAAKFPKMYSTEKIPEADKVVIAKFFHPLSNMTWYAVEYDPKDREFFGYVDTGDYDSEWGPFSLDEMNEINTGGLPMERDLHFKPQMMKDVPALQDKDFVQEAKDKEAREKAEQKIASSPKIGDSISDGLITGKVVGEGIIGKRIPAYRVELPNGKEDLIIKDQVTKIKQMEPQVSESESASLSALNQGAEEDKTAKSQNDANDSAQQKGTEWTSAGAESLLEEKKPLSELPKSDVKEIKLPQEREKAPLELPSESIPEKGQAETLELPAREPSTNPPSIVARTEAPTSVSETIGNYTVRPSGTWRVKLPDGTIRTFSYENDAQDVAQRHPGATVEPTRNWSVGRMVDGAWNGRSFATKEEAIAQAQKWASETTAPSVKPSITEKKPSTHKTKNLLEANAVADFQPGSDVVIRKGDQTFVHDTKGLHADIEVASDVLTPEYEANLHKLTPAQRTMAINATKTTPYLSKEGRAERLDILQKLESEGRAEQPQSEVTAKETSGSKAEAPANDNARMVKPRQPKSKTESKQSKEMPKPTEPVSKAVVEPKVKVSEHKEIKGHGHHIGHPVSTSENAAIHAWYHEHPAKNVLAEEAAAAKAEEAEKAKASEAVKPETKPMTPEIKRRIKENLNRRIEQIRSHAAPGYSVQPSKKHEKLLNKKPANGPARKSQLPPMHVKKEGQIYHIQGSGMTRSLRRGRLAH